MHMKTAIRIKHLHLYAFLTNMLLLKKQIKLFARKTNNKDLIAKKTDY